MSKSMTQTPDGKRDLGVGYEHVDHPPHYQGKVEVIDYIQDKLSHDEYIGFLKGNVLKYVSRLGRKESDKDDTKKAMWYLVRLIEIYGQLERPAANR